MSCLHFKNISTTQIIYLSLKYNLKLYNIKPKSFSFQNKESERGINGLNLDHTL